MSEIGRPGKGGNGKKKRTWDSLSLVWEGGVFGDGEFCGVEETTPAIQHHVIVHYRNSHVNGSVEGA